MKVVAVSGGMDPIHDGHIRMLEEAKLLGDTLVVILNNDNWLVQKKGYVFMPEEARMSIIRAIGVVDAVILTSHKKGCKDMSVCNELRQLRPNIFANGGDRYVTNIPEYKLCKELGIGMVFNVGGEKIQSSSKLVEDARKWEEKLRKTNVHAQDAGKNQS